MGKESDLLPVTKRQTSILPASEFWRSPNGYKGKESAASSPMTPQVYRKDPLPGLNHFSGRPGLT